MDEQRIAVQSTPPHTHTHTCMHARMIVCDYVKQPVSVSLQGEAALCQSADVQSRTEKPPKLPTFTGEAFAQARAGCVMHSCVTEMG